jgi:D-lactate dehydrogenase
MKLCFVTRECEDRAFFEAHLPTHDLEFVSEVSAAGEKTELLSVFVHDRVDQDALQKLPCLRLVATRSTGFDHIDLEACRHRDILVANVPTYGENTVAEHAFALILTLSRRLQESVDAVSNPGQPVSAFRGFDLKGKTLGIIGTGRIGLHAARIGLGFGMRVIAFDVYPRPYLADLLGFAYRPWEEVLKAAHVLTLHCPLTSENQHMINREALAVCPPGVILINTARGALVDTAALLEALDTGQVRGAGLDVLEGELTLLGGGTDHSKGTVLEEARVRDPARLEGLRTLELNRDLIARPNVVFTPHVAFNSTEAVQRINETTLDNLRGFFHQTPLNLV